MVSSSDLSDTKMTRLIPFLISCVLVVLMGCESDVENIAPVDVSSKLVVVSYISPQDTLLTVQLQKSQPAIGKRMTEEQMKVKDATVTMSDGSSSVRLAYNPATNLYEADAESWPVRAGKTYQLNVATPDGSKAEASCTVPVTDGIALTDVNITNVVVDDGSVGTVRKYSVSLAWRDAPQVKNYYRVLAYKEYYVTDTYGNKHKYREGITPDYGGNDFFDDDRTNNGILTSGKMEYYEYDDYPIDKPAYIHAILVVADKHYYAYHQAIRKQWEFDGNPFAEPAVMYTNIAGGLGVFAGYNQLEVLKELE